MCLQTTAEEEDKWGSVVRTDHQFFQEFVDDNENTKSLEVKQQQEIKTSHILLYY